jgi:cobalt/nickel transport system ATP-binding protein
MQPDVLLLDEPSGGLDDAATQRLIGVLAGLPQAMVVVSHDRAFWEAVTASAVELRGGKVDLQPRSG